MTNPLIWLLLITVISFVKSFISLVVRVEMSDTMPLNCPMVMVSLTMMSPSNMMNMPDRTSETRLFCVEGKCEGDDTGAAEQYGGIDAEHGKREENQQDCANAMAYTFIIYSDNLFNGVISLRSIPGGFRLVLKLKKLMDFRITTA